MTTLHQTTWEVAISLLSEDEPLAAKLRDELIAHVRGDIFLYSRKQDHIAADGTLVDLFKRVFRDEARLVVIVHRAEWGTTKYTSIEQDAIRARYLNEGARRILIISVDGTYPRSWYPEDLFRISVREFSMPQIAALVVARIEEAGGVIGPEDPVDRALRLKEIREKKEALANELTWHGPETIEAEAGRLFSELKAIASNITKKTGDAMDFDQDQRACRVNFRWGSLVFEWHRRIANSMEGTELAMSIIDAPTHFRGRRSAEPRILAGSAFDLAHPETDVWGWQKRKRVPRIPEFVESAELARWAINELLAATAEDPPPRSAPTPRRLSWAESWRL